MSPLIPALCLCLSFQTPAPRDRWVGEDKGKHFFASFVVTRLSASAARAAGLDPAPSAWVGAGVGATAGALKEIRDLRRREGVPSLKDAAWNLAGVGAATALARQVR